MAKKDIDITKTGPLGFKQLQAENDLTAQDLSPEFQMQRQQRQEAFAPISTFDMNQHQTEAIKTTLHDNNQWGDSSYDENNANEQELDYLSNTRGENQSGFMQITNGLTKGTLLAGTTFLDGTVGLLFGSAAAIQDNDISSIWNNDFSKALKSVNEWAETQIPNYYTNKELESPWYNNILTTNFIGDKFIKNLGFTIGAYYSGKAFAKAFEITKLPQLMGALTESTSAPGHVISGVGAAISSVNEGRIEALNNAMDFEEYKKVELEDKYKERIAGLDEYRHTEMYESMMKGLDIEYQKDLQKIKENSLKMGNADLLMNIGILFGPNILQFGKLYAGGASTAIRNRKIIGETGQYITGRTTTKGAIRAALNPLSEGMEEISQEAASNISGIYYGADIDNFYEGRINPKAEQQTINWLKATAQGINETVNDGNSWEQFFIGTLTGAMGMPQFRSARNKDGSFRSPITIEGGIKGEYSDYMEDMRADTELAEVMNKRMQDPNFLNYYQGLIRHYNYQNKMDDAVEEGNVFDYKDAEHSQMISDINMFSNAGKLGDFNTYLDTAFDTSDANLQSIIKNTTREIEKDGVKKTIGRFVDENGNSLLDTPEGKEQMIKELTKSKQQIEDKIKEYNNIKKSVLRDINTELKPEQLEELIWLKSKLSDWKQRAESITKEIIPSLRDVLDDYKETLEVTNLTEEFFGKEAEQKDLYLKNMTKAIEILDNVVNGKGDKAISNLLSRDKNLNKYLQAIIQNTFSDDIVDKKDIIQKLEDIYKTGQARESYSVKLNEFLNNPDNILESIQKVINDTQQSIKDNKYKSMLAQLDNVQHLGDITQILDNSEYSTEEIEEIIKQSNNPIVKDYYEVKQYKDKIVKHINDNVDDPVLNELANAMITYNIKETDKFKDLNNPYELDSSYEEKFYDQNKTAEENERLFIEAQYAIIEAMNAISKDEAYKDKFNTDFVKSIEEIIEDLRKSKEALDSTKDVTPVHNPPIQITVENDVTIVEENDETNEQLDEEKVMNNADYYRPIIPYYQQDAVKNKDFRKFVEVMADKNMDFKPIFAYLEEAGAFSYINDGKLKVGDKVGFMIDPSFDENTIFMIDSSNNQVIGSLPVADSKISQFTGMKELQQRIKEQYNQRIKSNEKFVADDTTNVSKIMLGKIETSDTQRSLKDIPNVTSDTIFGIVKNGRLQTNGKLKTSQITNLKDISNKEGRVYMLIPNARGQYSPMAVRTSRYNNNTISGQTEEQLNNNKPLREVQDLIAQLARVTSQDDVTRIMDNLSQLLYLTGIYVDYQDGNTGSFLRFSQYLYDENGAPIYKEVKGKRVHADKTTAIFLDQVSSEVGYFDENNVWQESESSEVDYTALVNQLDTLFQSFNRSMQVNLGMLNTQGYNQALLNSGILSSNVTNARMQGSWFTTDYIDADGQQQKAVLDFKPTVDPINPLGGKETILNGNTVSANGKDYVVNTEEKKIYNANNQDITSTLSKEQTELLFDVVLADQTYGSRMHSNRMINGMLFLDNGKVLDRKTNKYLTEAQANKVKKQLKDKKTKTAKSQETIRKLYEDQAKVDKEKTDSNNYYVLEDDGEYHPYTRVHNVIGNNWIETEEVQAKLDAIDQGLKDNNNSVVDFNKYLDDLAEQYEVKLDQYKDDLSNKNISDIKILLGDIIKNTQSRRALDAGSAIDTIIRDFFTNSNPSKPDNMSNEAYFALIDSLSSIKKTIDEKGELFITNNIVLHHKYANGVRVAGEVDILAIDRDGNFKIYDVKTSKYGFKPRVNNNGSVTDYFRNKGSRQYRSTLEQYTLQLSAYKNLFETAYGMPIKSLAILPYKLTYGKGSNNNVVETITEEDGIPIKYNKDIEGKIAAMKDKSDNTKVTDKQDIPVPKPKPINDNSSKEIIFNKSVEDLNPIDETTQYNDMDNSKQGYYLDTNNTVKKGPITFIGNINNIPIHVRKIVTMSNGGNEARALFPALKSFDVIFPNGNTLRVVNDTSYSNSDTDAFDAIYQALNGNPSRVVSESAKAGIKALLKEDTLPEVDSKIEDKDNSPETDINIKDKSQIDNIDDIDSTIKDDTVSPIAINDKFSKVDDLISDEFEEDELELRAVSNDMQNEEFSQEKELQWLDKVLPQLSGQERVQIIEDLGRVGNEKILGAFVNGSILLNTQSNNSKGTTYHEAFHAVMSLILTFQEKQTLLQEASTIFGELNNKQLEEKLAEEFRLYTQNYQNRKLGTKILDYFKRLFNITNNWNQLGPNITRVFYNINKENYSNRTLNVNVNSKEVTSKQSLESLDKATRDSLKEKGWTEEMWNKISKEEQEQAKYCS